MGVAAVDPQAPEPATEEGGLGFTADRNFEFHGSPPQPSDNRTIGRPVSVLYRFGLVLLRGRPGSVAQEPPGGSGGVSGRRARPHRVGHPSHGPPPLLQRGEDIDAGHDQGGADDDQRSDIGAGERELGGGLAVDGSDDPFDTAAATPAGVELEVNGRAWVVVVVACVVRLGGRGGVSGLVVVVVWGGLVVVVVWGGWSWWSEVGGWSCSWEGARCTTSRS